MLRDEKDRFLDDLTAKQLGEALGCEIEVIPTDGAGGCKAYLGELKPKPKRKNCIFLLVGGNPARICGANRINFIM